MTQTTNKLVQLSVKVESDGLLKRLWRDRSLSHLVRSLTESPQKLVGEVGLWLAVSHSGTLCLTRGMTHTHTRLYINSKASCKHSGNSMNLYSSAWLPLSYMYFYLLYRLARRNGRVNRHKASHASPPRRRRESGGEHRVKVLSIWNYKASSRSLSSLEPLITAL